MKYLEISDLACGNEMGIDICFAYVNKNELIKTTELTRTKLMDVCTRLKFEIPHLSSEMCVCFSKLNFSNLLVF